MAQLEYLGFQLIEPRPELRPYVRSYWYFERATPLLSYQEEYMHPTGGFGMVFNFGDELRLDAEPQPSHVFLDGVNTMTRRLGFAGHVELMGIRFREGGAYPFLGIPLVELQNKANIVEALSDASLLRLHARLYDAKSKATRIALLENWLLERLTLGVSLSPIIPASLGRLRHEIKNLREGNNLLSIPALADELAISQRQLEHLYRSQVGMTPLQYIRLHRIEIARLALSKQKQPNARLAADLGYYDQAHFIREFSSVIGITPYAYMKRKHPADE